MASRTRRCGLAFVVAALGLIGAWGAMPDRSTAQTSPCVDFATEGANLTHIFVESPCATSPSDFLITVDGQPVPTLYTDDGPCENIPRDVWFPLQGHQETAHVCVSVSGDCSGDIHVYAKAGNKCIPAPMP